MTDDTGTLPVPPGEPSPIRDNGPYRNADQAMKQFAAQTFGIPGPDRVHIGLVIREALLLTGLDLGTAFELDYLGEYLRANRLDPVFAQIIAGWIIRAHLSGMDKGRNKF